ncbi:MAG: M20 family metallopeptidase [Actinomycetota bacterium]
MIDIARTSAELLDNERLSTRLAALVRSESENPPGNEKRVAEITAAFCEELGLSVEMHEVEPGRPSVVARWFGGEGPTLTYCSHIDVVPAGNADLWDHDPYSGHVADGRLYGRGSGDAKGPCAAALEAVAVLKASGLSPKGTLELAFVADEESGGFKGAAPLVADGVLNPSVAIVGEPTSLRVVRAQRGIAWLKITTHGVAGHGSAPERGISAIRHMADLILRLEETLPDIEHPLLGRPTVNVGTISGGEKLNIIPASCVIEVDRRIVPGEDESSMLETIQDAIALTRQRFPEVDARVEVVSMGDPFEVPESAPVVQHAVRAIEQATGATPDIIGFRGASDARFMADAGADVIVCGPGDIQLAHTARESIDLEELRSGAHAYALMFASLLEMS